MKVFLLVCVVLLAIQDLCVSQNQDVDVSSLLQTVVNLQSKLEIMESKLNQVELEIAKQNHLMTELGDTMNYNYDVLRGLGSEAMARSSSAMEKATQTKVAKQNHSMTELGDTMNYNYDVLRGLGSEAMARSSSAMEKATQTKAEIEKQKTKHVFSVYMENGDFNKTGVIPFHGETANEGGFSLQTNKYTCPIGGYYFFSYTIFSNEIKYGGSNTEIGRSTATLKLDGQSVSEVYMYSYNEDGKMQMPGSNSVVIHCPAGGQVWLDTLWSGSTIWGKSDYKRTSFSGFLLSSD